MARLTIAAAAITLLAAAPAWADATLFVVDLPNEPASLDPHVQWDPDSYAVYRNVFDNLVTRDTAGRIVPQVATQWSQVSDTAVTFEIRDGIKFHDGSPLTPDDVAFSVQRIIDPAFKSPQLSQFDAIAKAEVTGPHQVTITTKRPYPVLLAQLTKLSIVPKAYVQSLPADQFNLKPMGSGPYRFVAWTKGVKVELAANPGYWRGPPPFPKVEMHPVTDEATRIADVRTGKADITRILSTDNANALKADAALKVLWAPTERATMLALNSLVGPTKDRRVREAIAHAIDRNLIIEALLKGYGKAIDAPMTPADFGYPDSGLAAWDYDPAKSKALLAQAGLSSVTVSFPTSPVFDQRVVQAVQQMLGDVGITAKIETTDLPTYLVRRQGKPEDAGDISFFRWSCGCQDADGVLFPLFHSSSQWAKYKDPKVDQALETARSSLDQGARLKAYVEALSLIHDDVAVVPLYQDVVMFVAKKAVQWQPTANEAFFLFDMAWKP